MENEFKILRRIPTGEGRQLTRIVANFQIQTAVPSAVSSGLTTGPGEGRQKFGTCQAKPWFSRTSLMTETPSPRDFHARRKGSWVMKFNVSTKKSKYSSNF